MLDESVHQSDGLRDVSGVLGGVAARRVHQRRGRAGRRVSQAGLALGRRVRRRSPSPRPRSQGPLPDVRSARGDRAGHRGRRDDPRDRAAFGACAVDGVARADRNADRRGGRYRATSAHALAYDRASRPKPAKLWRSTWRCASACRTICCRSSHPSRSPGACAAGFPRTGDVGVDRDDLPIAVRAVAGRAASPADGLRGTTLIAEDVAYQGRSEISSTASRSAVGAGEYPPRCRGGALCGERSCRPGRSTAGRLARRGSGRSRAPLVRASRGLAIRPWPVCRIGLQTRGLSRPASPFNASRRYDGWPRRRGRCRCRWFLLSASARTQIRSARRGACCSATCSFRPERVAEDDPE